MIDFKVEQSDDKRILLINGELTIQNASELKRILMESINNSEHVVLNLENVTEMDLSSLQLLYSAHRTAAKSNRRFTLSNNCPEVFKKAVKDTGYLRHFGCESDCDMRCL